MEQSPTPREEKRLQMEGEDEIEIIRSTDLELIREIGNGPGYLLHAGRNRSRAVIVKVFHRGPTVRQQLETTVTLSKELLHPNVLRIKGISSPISPSRFIVYENGHCVNAEILLAAALKSDLARSVTLGFTMVAEISAGISHLCMQGVWPRSMGVANFHILVSPKDQFSIMINAPHSQEVEAAAPQEPKDNALIVFNAVLDKTLMSANRVLHKEIIKRDPAIPNPRCPSFAPGDSAATAASSIQNIQGDELAVPPRREYVWRTMEHGRQALAEVSEGLTADLQLHLSRLSRLTRTDGSSAHRCPGYVREEITLATTILESVVVAHDTPSPLEECPVCHEVVGFHEKFRCICSDLAPGLRHTVKCRECKLWSHSDCVGNPKEFICQLCVGFAMEINTDGAHSVGGDLRSASPNRRPKRGARKGRFGSQPPSSPKDETLENLAIASQALAREISRASRAFYVQQNTTGSSTRSRGRPFKPVSMYAVPVGDLPSAPPLPKIHQRPAPKIAPAPPSPASDSSTSGKASVGNIPGFPPIHPKLD
ncbi:hypothetical protein B0H19DRAFT_106219 [Mycena capillaripes]|nr:hypothetical protein B0H19DRAFT_106219 [Mycena capillaripes]